MLQSGTGATVMKQPTKNLPSLYIELAKELRETLEKPTLISIDPEKNISFSIPSGNIFDEFRNIFHYRLAEYMFSKRDGLSSAQAKGMVEKTLNKYESFTDNKDLYAKSEKIVSIMDNTIERTFIL